MLNTKTVLRHKCIKTVDNDTLYRYIVIVKTPKKRKPGRPSIYNNTIADKICTCISDGNSLRTIAAMPGMPNLVTVFRWLRRHEEFSKQYARAKEEQAEALIEDMLDIADDNQRDRKMVSRNGEEVEVVDNDVINRARLRVDTRKWIASKLQPKKFGDKLDMTSDGERLQTIPATLTIRVAKD